MSSRPRRALVGLVAAVAAFTVLPASALAAGETFSITPANPTAGSNPSLTATLHFAPGQTPGTVVTSLAPGLLANLNANPTCLAGSPQLTTACQIGSTSTTTSASPTAVPGTLYLVPPQNAGDAAGIDAVTTGRPAQYIGVSLNPSVPGGLNLTTTFPNPGGGVQITDFSATFNPTLNGQPFTRVPSSCSTANNTANITYYSGTTGSATGSFTPTGCPTAQPYAPVISAAITKDTKDNGAALVFGITQAANESPSKSIVLSTPSGLTPNLAADVACLSGTPCKVGTAMATSPLVPSVALANGTVTLGGTALAPTVTIAFPAPIAISITGTLSLTNNAVTFSNVPDIPLTSLTVNITGPNGQKAFNTDCAPATLGGAFTAQSGATHSASAPIVFNGCANRPSTRGSSTGGLASGHPKLKFAVTHGKGAPRISAVSIGLPSGLRFSRSAFVTHKTCTVKSGKQKCTTTTLIKGLGISGAKAKAVALRRGRLVITLKGTANKVTIAVSEPLVTESKSLQNKVKKHKVKSLRFTLKVTDAKHTTTTLPVRLRAH